MTKTIFITGASAGLGKATAKLFQAQGWKVIATMRDPRKETELTALSNVTLLPLDITDPKAIASTVATVTETGKIDVVFNNAGFGLSGALEAYTDEAIVEQINTNLLGAIRVTQAFLPHFKAQQSGLFIITTSVFGFITCPLSSIYNATKWALEGWAESMYYELAPFNIGIKTVAPGLIQSNFIKGMKSFSHPAYDPLFEKMLKVFIEDKFLEASSPELIAQVVFEAATDQQDQVRYLAGNDAVRLSKLRAELGNEGYRKHFTGLLA